MEYNQNHHNNNIIENKISLVQNNDLDYLDMLYREKFRYGTEDEIIIKLK